MNIHVPFTDEGWHWPAWLPAGFLTLLIGPISSGKSALALHIAGCCLTGRAWPDGTPNHLPSGTVIWVETEASFSLNLARAHDWHLPAGRILPPLYDPLIPLDLFNKTSRQFFFANIRSPGTRLVVIDSLRGLIPSGSAAHYVTATTILANAAQVSGLPFLVTHHLRKPRPGQSPRVTIYDVYGPIAIVQLARVIWAIDHPAPTAPRRLTIIKNNLSSRPAPLSFTIDHRGLHFAPASPAPPLHLSAGDRATAFLLDLLATGPLPAVEITTAYESAGYARATILRAKRQLNIISFRRHNHWYWALPDHSTPFTPPPVQK